DAGGGEQILGLGIAEHHRLLGRERGDQGAAERHRCSRASWQSHASRRHYRLPSVRHPFFAAPRPLVFAHRGGSALAPENTLAAFDNGLALGADGLELDVHLSRDGVVVVHHDLLLDRTTNLHGDIARATAAELERADAGYHFTSGGTHPFRGRGIGVP